MADEKTHVDAVTGTATTGHEWDGIRELNTPLPRWWLWLFYLTIVWAAGYWVVYPAWPLVSSFTRGAFGWSSRDAVATDLDDLKSLRAPMNSKLAAAALGDIAWTLARVWTSNSLPTQAAVSSRSRHCGDNSSSRWAISATTLSGSA